MSPERDIHLPQVTQWGHSVIQFTYWCSGHCWCASGVPPLRLLGPRVGLWSLHTSSLILPPQPAWGSLLLSLPQGRTQHPPQHLAQQELGICQQPWRRRGRCWHATPEHCGLGVFVLQKGKWRIREMGGCLAVRAQPLWSLGLGNGACSSWDGDLGTAMPRTWQWAHGGGRVRPQGSGLGELQLQLHSISGCLQVSSLWQIHPRAQLATGGGHIGDPQAPTLWMPPPSQGFWWAGQPVLPSGIRHGGKHHEAFQTCTQTPRPPPMGSQPCLQDPTGCVAKVCVQVQVHVGSTWCWGDIQSWPVLLSHQHVHLSPDDAAMIPRDPTWSPREPKGLQGVPKGLWVIPGAPGHPQRAPDCPRGSRSPQGCACPRSSQHDQSLGRHPGLTASGPPLLPIYEGR